LNPSLPLRALKDGRELLVVVAAAALGLSVRSPFAAFDRHQGINILLGLLVFATGLTIEPKALRVLPASWLSLALMLAVGITVLPVLSWALAQLLDPGALREGVAAVGLAPCEIASVAVTAMAGGDVALAAGCLIGSTVLTVVVAGPVLSWEVSGVPVHTGHLLTTLLVVVVVPLFIALGLRSWLSVPVQALAVARESSMLLVSALVALIAAETHLSVRYLAVAGVLVLFLAASALLGSLLGLVGKDSGARRAVLLTTSMRDFAIAAALAGAAFGPRATGPLGLYGIVVLVWGTACAAALRRGDPAGPAT
jgi:predicted Na+-dependent transporter